MKTSHPIYLACGLAVLGVCAGAQTPKTQVPVAESCPAPKGAFAKEIGDLEARYDRADWRSPELILQGLRSDNDDARLKAFRLLGATDDDAHEVEGGLNGEATLVATPWKSELLYAPPPAPGTSPTVAQTPLCIPAKADVHWRRPRWSGPGPQANLGDEVFLHWPPGRHKFRARTWRGRAGRRAWPQTGPSC